jgi:hypothetical protein
MFHNQSAIRRKEIMERVKEANTTQVSFAFVEELQVL